MVWDKERILQKLRQLHKSKKDLSYNSLCRTQQPLLSAAAYHFGSYRKAIEKSGIDYADIIRRPRWTKPAIIKLIKEAKRKSHDLHWSAVTKRRDELGKAAFASLQPRLFGRWDRALQAAGLDSDDVARYRKWDRNSIVFELKSRSQNRQPLNSGSIQQEDPGLHAAAVRHFGSYDKSLHAAKLDPAEVRQRHTWTKPEVLKALKAAAKDGKHLSDSSIRREDPALYGAAIRLFGTFTSARDAAHIKWKRATPKH
jgi:hypothetical protein